jgi:hypothetical protein
MPFPWYHPDVPAELADAGQKAAAMYEQELTQRAALLLHLGYSREEAKTRLRANVRWDFELHQAPAHLKRVGAIVDQVYAARGAGRGGPPTV